MSKRERAILVLREAGDRVEDIARYLDLKLAYVEQIIRSHRPESLVLAPSYDQGMSPREREIMVLSEAGDSIEDISRFLKLDRAYVRQVVRDYSFASCWRAGDRANNASRIACKAHAAAIAATGKRYA